MRLFLRRALDRQTKRSAGLELQLKLIKQTSAEEHRFEAERDGDEQRSGVLLATVLREGAAFEQMPDLSVRADGLLLARLMRND